MSDALQAGPSREEAFWERYRLVVLRSGVKEGVAVWYRRHVERFIGFLKPRRLREAQPADVAEFLLRMHRQKDLEAWHWQQADRALRLLYQEMVRTDWAAEWSVPLPVQEVAESVPSADLGAGPIYTEWGDWGPTLERMVRSLRTRHYAYRTEQTYVEWAERFVRSVSGRPVESVGVVEVKAFLEWLAVEGKVASGTQNQALNALVFYYRDGLQRPLRELGEYERAKAPRRLPVVLTREEVVRVVDRMEGAYQLMAVLIDADLHACDGQAGDGGDQPGG